MIFDRLNISKIYIFIILSSFIFGQNQILNIETLLNEKLAIVTNEGIYFYTSKMNEERKYIFENQFPSIKEPHKISIAQFSKDNDKYIIVLVNKTIYFFNKNGNIINFKYLSNFINIKYYSLIPYKKQDNYLYYIITYLQKDKNSFIIHYFIFNINYPNSNQIITSKIVEINMQN